MSEQLACRVSGKNRSAFREKKPEMGFEEVELRADLQALVVKLASNRPASGALTGLNSPLARSTTGATLLTGRHRASTQGHRGRRKVPGR